MVKVNLAARLRSGLLLGLLLESVAAYPFPFNLSELKARAGAAYNDIREQERANRPHDAYSFDCTPGKFADAGRIEQIQTAEAESSAIPVKKIFDQNDPDEYLIFIAADGTEKNSSAILGLDDTSLLHHLRSMQKSKNECLKLEQEKTLETDIAHYKSERNALGIPESVPSNPALLSWLILKPANSHVRAIYVRGVGSDSATLLMRNLISAGTGDALRDQINEAYQKVQAALIAIRQASPKSKFVFVTTGFSRGAASIRALHNRILRDGIKGDSGDYIVEPQAANIGASVLFDTVITERPDIYSNIKVIHAKSKYQAIDAREYDIPKEVVQVLHITAENEYRVGFELRSARGSNVKELAMPGAHSDIGGGYEFDRISAVTLQMAIDYLMRAGVPLGAPPNEFKPNKNNYVIHDSRKFPKVDFDRQLQQQRRSNLR